MPVVVDLCGYTKAGTTHGGVNQDSFVLDRGVVPGVGIVVLAAVFDGHSPGGELAARTAADRLRYSFTQCNQLDDSDSDEPPHPVPWALLGDVPGDVMEALFLYLHKAIIQAYADLPSPYTYVSGDKVVVAHAGDSPVVLTRCNLDNKPDGLDLKLLIRSHSVRRKEERARISESCGSRVAFTDDFYLMAADDPLLAQHQVQTSRSLGHRHLSKYGVVSDPDIYVRVLDRETCFAVCVLSDGITDGMRMTTILDVVATAKDAESAAQRLVRDAHATSVALRSKSDDCTAVVLCF